MEFLKGCTTNLQTVDGYTSIEYNIYSVGKRGGSVIASESRAGEGAGTGHGVDNLQDFLLELRESGILTQSVPFRSELWTFGTLSEEAEHLLQGQQYPFVRSSKLEIAALSRSSQDSSELRSEQFIYGLFLSALEASLSLTLLESCGAVHLGPLTWIVPLGDNEISKNEAETSIDPGYVLLALQAHITQGGRLLLAPATTSTDLLPLSHSFATDIPLGSRRVLLAPSGAVAEIVNFPLSEGRKESGDTFQLNGHRERTAARARLSRQSNKEKWQSMVTRGLGQEIPFLEEDEKWVEVRITSHTQAAGHPDNLLACLWPASLCFGRYISTNMATDSIDALDWLQPETVIKHPLKVAEDWFTGSAERAQAALTAEKSRQLDEERDATLLRTSHGEGHPVSAASPLYPRAQEQVNASGIYPTPPDGMAPGASSDPNMPTITATDDGHPRQDSSDGNPQTGRRRSMASDMDFDPEPYRNNHADLFGDADEDENMFGGDDVNDADFSFFDDDGAPNFAGAGDSNDTEKRASVHMENNETLAARDGHVPTTAQQKPDPEDRTNVIEPSQTADSSEKTSLLTLHYEDGENESARTNVISPEASKDSLGFHDTEQAGVPRPVTPPLSPLSIKERLLPLPIPASQTKPESEALSLTRTRRDSNYDPVTFNQGFDSFAAKYGLHGRFASPGLARSKADSREEGSVEAISGRSNSLSIVLPEKRKRSRPNIPLFIKAHTVLEPVESGDEKAIIRTSGANNASSEEDSYTDDDSDAESSTVYAPVKPLKRKRDVEDHGIDPLTRSFGDLLSESESESTADDRGLSEADQVGLLDTLLVGDAQKDPSASDQAISSLVSQSGMDILGASVLPHQDLWEECFNWQGHDVVAVAQFIMQEASINAALGDLSDAVTSLDGLSPEQTVASILRTVRTIAQATTKQHLHALVDIDFTKLLSHNGNADQSAVTKMQPRPAPQRSMSRPGGAAATQSCLPIPTPMIRFQRADSTWEMLPLAVTFWEALGLEPTNGPKNVVAFAVYPSVDDLETVVEEHLSDIGSAYEGCKLGRYRLGDPQSSHPTGLVPVSVPTEMDALPFTTKLICNIQKACHELALKLADDAAKGAFEDVTIMVHMVNPFADPSMTKYICGCFWELYESFTTSIEDLGVSPKRNMVLHILPIGLIASQHTLVIPDAATLAQTARSIYDRCDSTTEPDYSSVWRFPASASIELVPPLPRKINFSLSPNPPPNLMAEANILHLAYSISRCGTWLSAAWTDISGRHQIYAAYPINSNDLQSTLAEVSDVTTSMMAHPHSVWRLFVAKPGSMTTPERRHWLDINQGNSRIAVACLDLDTDPILRVSPPEPPAAASDSKTQPGQGFLTPASTPQSAAPLTVSPNEAPTPTATGSGQSAPQSTAAPAEDQPPDPDTHLVDQTDESWGLTVPFPVTRQPSPYTYRRVLASGMLLKRGEVGAERLPSLGVDLVGIAVPKVEDGGAKTAQTAGGGSGGGPGSSGGNSGGSGGGNALQGGWLMGRTNDMVVRECLIWFRALGLLAKVRGVKGCKDGTVPWHVAMAVSGAKGLSGFVER
ncbi:mediator of RNA polymerase II transcription subunit 13 [Zalaria obscura]|uniref:Mediator of RNA polymerase II transcription subunit 13 n=1 Tax=Zalaria obscura TaxID=2024903 RepID=A0ACC3SLC6_9PEZI